MLFESRMPRIGADGTDGCTSINPTRKSETYASAYWIPAFAGMTVLTACDDKNYLQYHWWLAAESWQL